MCTYVQPSSRINYTAWLTGVSIRRPGIPLPLYVYFIERESGIRRFAREEDATSRGQDKTDDNRSREISINARSRRTIARPRRGRIGRSERAGERGILPGLMTLLA